MVHVVTLTGLHFCCCLCSRVLGSRTGSAGNRVAAEVALRRSPSINCTDDMRVPFLFLAGFYGLEGTMRCAIAKRMRPLITRAELSSILQSDQSLNMPSSGSKCPQSDIKKQVGLNWDARRFLQVTSFQRRVRSPLSNHDELVMSGARLSFAGWLWVMICWRSQAKRSCGSPRPIPGRVWRKPPCGRGAAEAIRK